MVQQFEISGKGGVGTIEIYVNAISGETVARRLDSTFGMAGTLPMMLALKDFTGDINALRADFVARGFEVGPLVEEN